MRGRHGNTSLLALPGLGSNDAIGPGDTLSGNYLGKWGV